MPRTVNVLIVTHYFPPEVGAPQSRLGFLAKALVRRGHGVRVLTSLPSYPSGNIPPTYRGRLVVREEWQGVPIIRTWTYARPGHSFARRILNHLSFASSLFFALPTLGSIDLILLESPPVFLAFSGVVLKLLKRGRLVVHVSDLWVKALANFGFLTPGGWLHRFLVGFERLSYRFSDALIVVSPGMVADVAPKQSATQEVRVIANGVDTETFHPVADRGALKKALNLEGKFLLIFAGTHGHVTDTAVFVEAARQLASFPDIHFLFVGDGVGKPGLVTLARKSGLSNMTFLDPLPEDRLAEVINAADVGLNTLKPVDFTEHIISVKVFTYMACGIPVITTDKEALREIVLASGAGILVPEGNAGALRDAILELYRDEEKRRTLGAAGTRYVTRTYSRQIAAEKTERLFLDLLGEPATTVPLAS
jgi:colanic acid biosynthesis glycosyl transferase WcaI